VRRASATLAGPVARPLGPPFRPRPVRDALGLVRLLWAVEREGTDLDRTKLLTEVGKTLGECLEMGARYLPESLAYRAAVSRSAEAMDKLAAVPWSADLAEVVRRAKDRVHGVKLRAEDERDAKRRAVAARG
jgi:hypothetical protein